MRKTRIAVLAALLWVELAWMSTSCPPPALRSEPAPAPVAELRYSAEVGEAEMDINLLADVAMAEDPSAGVAVMWTIINRSRESGRSYLDVVSDGEYHGYQTVDSWRRWRHPLDRAEVIRLRETARLILLGLVPDPTRGATHFHALGTWLPPWAPGPRARVDVGASTFYRARS